MLTDEDIKKLSKVLTTKQDLKKIEDNVAIFKDSTERNFEDVREDISGLRETIQGLATAVDGLTKVIEDLRVEYAAISAQLSRHEKWIKQIAEKAGIKLEY